jgi:hypothetical protein
LMDRKENKNRGVSLGDVFHMRLFVLKLRRRGSVNHENETKVKLS